MNKDVNAKIFLAEERGCTETHWFRSYNTFNFGRYQNPHKGAFNSLYVLNDDTLAAGRSFKLTLEEDTIIILLPIVGAVAYKIADDEGVVTAGELQLLRVHKNEVIEILNPFEEDLINFLQLWFKKSFNEKLMNKLYSFDFNKKNQLLSITGNKKDTNVTEEPVISIGKLIGREELFYTPINQANSIFVFAIQGVFEVQGRLLHQRDSLALWHEPGSIELEALSNDAIILFIEL